MKPRVVDPPLLTTVTFPYSGIIVSFIYSDRPGSFE
jgi:hypothetical protein